LDISLRPTNTKLFPDVLITTCSDGMNGYLTPCSGETHPPVFRSPMEGMEDILTNQVMWDHEPCFKNVWSQSWL